MATETVKFITWFVFTFAGVARLDGRLRRFDFIDCGQRWCFQKTVKPNVFRSSGEHKRRRIARVVNNQP